MLRGFSLILLYFVNGICIAPLALSIVTDCTNDFFRGNAHLQAIREIGVIRGRKNSTREREPSKRARER